MKISNFKFQISNQKEGFTLIELLIVMAIIGVLAALIMSNFIGIRQRGRDAQRKSNIREIQAALELYRSDLSNYPQDSQFTSCGKGIPLKDLNSPTIYMSTIPCDPLTGNPYQYKATGTTYTLVACLENSNDQDIDPNPPSGFPCPNNSDFVVTNP